ncbi:hypothetical protein DITRI_Ditri06bG0172500 [Diplodiscus trichospermus]
MTEKIQGKTGVFVPPDSQLSYVLSITLPQPTIRIKIPKVLVKAMQKRNLTSTENDEKGIRIKKKILAESKNSFRKKVGLVFSNLFGKNKSANSDSKGENSEVHGDGDGEGMKNSKNIVGKSEKITGKISTEDQSSNDGVQQMAAAETDEKQKERPKSRRTFPKRNDEMEQNTGKLNNVDGSTVGENGGNTVGPKGGNPKDLPWFRSTRQSSNRKPKIVRSMKNMSSVLVGGKSGKNELCKKRILMGVRCRPLNHSGKIEYDENGILLPEFSP